jgi:hypothetical protein
MRVNLELDLDAFDGSRFVDVVEGIRSAHIRISNMAKQGNTEEAQRKLFYLNSWCATLDLPRVDQRYRRDTRIGLALKLAAIHYCIAQGVHKLGDNHDARDATNLALCYSLGFTALSAVIHLNKRLG